MQLTKKQLSDMIDRCEDAAASPATLTKVRGLTPKQFLKHEQISFFLYWYALRVLNKRWPEAEDIIKKDPFYWECYCRDLINFKGYSFDSASDAVQASYDAARVCASDAVHGGDQK